jgi:hypothetical protein
MSMTALCAWVCGVCVQAMGDAQDLVDDTVDEFNRQTELVTLQGQFMGYVDLYGADRRLLKEVHRLGHANTRAPARTQTRHDITKHALPWRQHVWSRLRILISTHYSCFVGCLTTQATLKKIYIDNSGRKPQDRHIHLFNDALIYSSKMVGPYKYKVRDTNFQQAMPALA